MSEKRLFLSLLKDTRCRILGLQFLPTLSVFYSTSCLNDFLEVYGNCYSCFSIGKKILSMFPAPSGSVKIFSLSLVSYDLNMIFLRGGGDGVCVWSLAFILLLVLSDFEICHSLLHWFEKVLSHYCFKYFFFHSVLFSGILIINMLHVLTLFHISWMICFLDFFKNLFPPWISVWEDSFDIF